MIQKLVREKKPLRVVCLVDSLVVRGTLSKGRTSSRGLAPILRRICATATAWGIYPVLPYVPSRLNASDDPTRERPLRAQQKGLVDDGWQLNNFKDLSRSSQLKRWSSNWVRLVLRLLGPDALRFSDRSLFRSFGFRQKTSKSVLDFSTLDFDATLGFPGEGPLLSILLAVQMSLSGLRFLVYPRHRRSVCCPFSVWWWWLFVCSFSSAMAAPFEQTEREAAKARERALLGPLPQGRTVLEVTSSQRDRLLASFANWLQSEGLSYDELLQNAYHNVEDLNILLTRYGRQLYERGKPLAHYSETLNALSAVRPVLRRNLQGAWDMAYSWVRREPSSHHVAMPGQVLLSMVAISYIWGWLRFAGCLALGWGAILRTGEVLQARRRDLYLPSDGGNFVNFALLAIMEPKTRFSTARHQSAKLDIPDLLQVVVMAFESLRPDDFLWHQSPQSFRKRFRQVLAAVGLPCEHHAGLKPLDPGSLRPGGATWLLQTFESGDLLLRRGRWALYRVMSIYIQEVSAVMYLARLPLTIRTRVLGVASCFSSVLEFAQLLLQAKIPTEVWYNLFLSAGQKGA